MGFNQRWLDKERCFHALANNGLKQLYGKSDSLTFLDEESSNIYEMFLEGLTDDQIANKYGIERVVTANNE
jgi:DNA-binding NarL/FixJ family response regulator